MENVTLSVVKRLHSSVFSYVCALLMTASTLQGDRRRILGASDHVQRGDTLRLWSTFKDLLGRSRSSSSQTAPFTAEAFADYYEWEISSIRQHTAQSPEPTFTSTSLRFTELAEVTELDLRRLIISSPPSRLN